jgi:MFS family permease
MNKKFLAALVLLVFLGSLGIDIHLSSLPFIMSEFHASGYEIQQSISLFLLGLGCSVFCYGPLSDKYGRKPIVLAGCLIAIPANALVLMCHQLHYFLFLRVLQGIGSGVTLGLGRVILSDLVQGEAYVISSSYLTMITGLSPIIAPLIGSYIQTYLGWRVNFLLLSLLFVIIFIIFLFSTETNPYKKPLLSLSNVLQNYLNLLASPLLLSFCLLAGIGLGTEVLYIATNPFVLQNTFHLSPIIYGWVSGAVGISLILGRFMLPTLMKYFGLMRTILLGLIILGNCGVLLGFFLWFKFLTIPTFLFSTAGIFFSYSFIVLCSSSCAMNLFPDKRGAVGALYGGSQMLTAFLINLWAASFQQEAPLVLCVTYIFLAMAGVSLYHFYVKRRYVIYTQSE